MPATIQIRNVRDDLHRTLEARAALAGQSLSDYLLGLIRHIAERPTQQEMLERLRKRPPINPSIDPVDIIREERDRRRLARSFSRAREKSLPRT